MLFHAGFRRRNVEQLGIFFKTKFLFIFFLEYSLSGHRNMIMKPNPDMMIAKHLRIWYDAGGRLNNNQLTTNSRPAFDS